MMKRCTVGAYLLLADLTVAIDTAECPSHELPDLWVPDLMYCAWSGHPFDDAFEVGPLASCLAAIPDDASSDHPARDYSLLSEFSGVVRTDCAKTCILNTVNAIINVYLDSNFLALCNVTAMSWETLMESINDPQCQAAVGNGT